MSARQTNYSIDFYYQLSLLLKSNLPLPGSIRSLAAGVGSRRFRETVKSLADSVESGETLSAAMKRYPEVFPAQYVEVIEAGEASGTLAAALHEIGVSAQADYQVASLCRDILFYPVIVIFTLIAIFVMICLTTVYPVRELYLGLVGYEHEFPFIIHVAVFLHDNLAVLGIFYLLMLSFCFWLLSGGGAANRMLLSIVRVIPGVGFIFEELANARLCIFWSMMLKRSVPEGKTFQFLELSTDDRRLKEDLKTIGTEVAAGTPVGTALDAGKAISPVIKLTFQHVPEERIPDELEHLSQMFLTRASAALRRISAVGEVAVTLILAAVILVTIVSLFRPFIRILEWL